MLAKPCLSDLLFRLDDVTFIDFEYCNPNPVAFDIGNHLNEYAGHTCQLYSCHIPHISIGLGDYDVSRLPSDEKIAEWISNYLTASHGTLCASTVLMSLSCLLSECEPAVEAVEELAKQAKHYSKVCPIVRTACSHMCPLTVLVKGLPPLLGCLECRSSAEQ